MNRPPPAARGLFAALMALQMSLIISAVITYVNVGGGAFPWPWVKVWALAFMVAFPLVLILAPLNQRLVARLLGPSRP